MRNHIKFFCFNLKQLFLIYTYFERLHGIPSTKIQQGLSIVKKMIWSYKTEEKLKSSWKSFFFIKKIKFKIIYVEYISMLLFLRMNLAVGDLYLLNDEFNYETSIPVES